LSKNSFFAGHEIRPEIQPYSSRNKALGLLPQRGTVLDNSLKRRASRPANAATRKDGR
jgi:hypothetical protein